MESFLVTSGHCRPYFRSNSFKQLICWRYLSPLPALSIKHLSISSSSLHLKDVSSIIYPHLFPWVISHNHFVDNFIYLFVLYVLQYNMDFCINALNYKGLNLKLVNFLKKYCDQKKLPCQVICDLFWLYFIILVSKSKVLVKFTKH